MFFCWSSFFRPPHNASHLSPKERKTQPPMVARKMEALLECVHKACTFFARLAPICMLGRRLLTKFLHRSSVGSLLRERVGWEENIHQDMGKRRRSSFKANAGIKKKAEKKIACVLGIAANFFLFHG